MASPNKTPTTNTGSKTDNLPSDVDKRELPTVSGSIADTKVKDQALKPASPLVNADQAISAANPALSGADPQQGHAPCEDDAGLSS